MRSYASVFVRTRDEADRLAEEMAQTLAHFPTLEIAVEFDPDAAPTDSAQESAIPYVVHLFAGSESAVGPLRGADVSPPVAIVADDLWSQLVPRRRCPHCAGLAKD